MCEGHGSHYAGKECPDCKGTGKVYKEPVVKAEEDKCVDCGKNPKQGKDFRYGVTMNDIAYVREGKENNQICPKCLMRRHQLEKAEEGIGGMNMGSQRGLGHEAGYKQDPGQSAQITEVKEEKEKSAYENHEQDESPDSQPNKQQIPPSKPGMDALKMYKKALIIKYNNIYKPANI